MHNKTKGGETIKSLDSSCTFRAPDFSRGLNARPRSVSRFTPSINSVVDDGIDLAFRLTWLLLSPTAVL